MNYEKLEIEEAKLMTVIQQQNFSGNFNGNRKRNHDRQYNSCGADYQKSNKRSSKLFDNSKLPVYEFDNSEQFLTNCYCSTKGDSEKPADVRSTYDGETYSSYQQYSSNNTNDGSNRVLKPVFDSVSDPKFQETPQLIDTRSSLAIEPKTNYQEGKMINTKQFFTMFIVFLMSFYYK